ncbi:MAG TPA: ABC transporter permease [Streptosporangiaceae bacterium]|nr:ABC transporter permease [Streptosporangiaceae bacterium]
MSAYLARRALQAVAVVVVVTLIVFGLLSLAPGNAITAVLGAGAAHRPFLLAYLTWLGRVLHGNLGFSDRLNVSVGSLLAASLPRTVVLTGLSTLLALLIAVPVGLLQAVRRNTATDHVLRLVTYLCYGTPTFVLGALLILVLGVDLHTFGAEGPQATGIVAFATDLRDLTLPVLTLTVMTVAIFARYMRSSALDSLAQEYVEAARARGAGERRVLAAHVLRNSLVPVVTLLGLSLPQIVGGAVLVEGLFNIQGMGWQIWQAALRQDAPVTLGFTLVIGVAAAIGSLLADIGYALLDPRVRYAQP